MADLSLKAPAPRQGVSHAGVPRAIRWLANPRWTDDSRTMLYHGLKYPSYQAPSL